jgi:hypothetical protein
VDLLFKFSVQYKIQWAAREREREPERERESEREREREPERESLFSSGSPPLGQERGWWWEDFKGGIGGLANGLIED